MELLLINEIEGRREWRLSMVSRVSLCAWDSAGTRWDRHGACDCIARKHSLWRSREGALAHEAPAFMNDASVDGSQGRNDKRL
jgi:hypothetical protein